MSTGEGPAATAPPERARDLALEHQRITRQLLFFARSSFVLVGTMPWWLPLARAYLPLGPVGQVFDLLFVVLCHRLPERTVELAGVAMPVCSRCAGIFTGLALGALFAWPRLRLRAARYAIAAAGLIMLLDVLAQDLDWHPLWHSTRLLTGGLLGYVMACALVAAIVRERRGEPR